MSTAETGGALYPQEALDAAASELGRQGHGGPADPDDIKLASDVLAVAVPIIRAASASPLAAVLDRAQVLAVITKHVGPFPVSEELAGEICGLACEAPGSTETPADPCLSVDASQDPPPSHGRSREAPGPVLPGGHRPGPRRMLGRRIAPTGCWSCGQPWPCDGSWQARAEAAEAKVAEYENAITWNTSCTSCARLLDSSYAETVRREQAEATLAEVWQAMETFITIRGEYAQAGDLVEGLRQIRDRQPLDRGKSSSEGESRDH